MIDKKARSEQLRLESLRRKEEEKRKRNALITSSLNDVDKVNPKKIIFQDSDSDAEENPIGKKLKLFDDDEADKDMELVVPTRHIGKQGEKLMKLEKKFGDDRFKLDSKFASESEEEDEISIERNKNRELLSKVLGREVKAVASAISAKARPFTRFDPENEEHIEWMKAYGDGGSGEKNELPKETEEDVEETISTHLAEGNYFSLDKDFANELREKVNGEAKEVDGFSFLQFMGRPSVLEEEKKSKYSTQERDFYESNASKSSEEKSQARHIGKTETSEGATKKGQLYAQTKFFLTGNEAHIKSVVANFRQTQSIEKTVGTWSNYRNAIMKIYRHKRKAAKKLQKEHKFQSKKKTQIGDS